MKSQYQIIDNFLGKPTLIPTIPVKTLPSHTHTLYQNISQIIEQQGGPARNRGFGPNWIAGVGYQPVIITLPEGCNLAATAVVSADRRYVRFTGMPMFSGISKVSTFNSSTGDMNTLTPAGAGQGYSGIFGGGNAGGLNPAMVTPSRTR